MASRQPRRKTPARPRAPLPRQKGGAHEDKTKRTFRRRKHRKSRRQDRRVGCFCLSACFRRPQYVAYAHAASGVPDQPPAVSGAVRRRGGLPAVPGGVSLAGRLSLSALRPRPGLPAGRVAAGMRGVSLPGVVDSGHRVPPDKDPADGVVLGRIFDDDRQAGDLGAAASTPAGHPVGMRRPGGSCTSSGEPWSTPPGSPLHGEVELDDTWVGGPQPGLRGSRQLKGRKAALVAVAVEKRGTPHGAVPEWPSSRISARPR